MAPGRSAKEALLCPCGWVHAKRVRRHPTIVSACRFDDTALFGRRLGRLAKPLKANMQFLPCRRHLDWHEFSLIPLRERELLARKSEEMARQS